MTVATRLARLNNAVVSAAVGHGETVRHYPKAGPVVFDLPDGLTAGQTVALPDSDLDSCTLSDQDGVAVDAALWTCDLAAGLIEMVTPLDLASYAEPLRARYVYGTDLLAVIDIPASEPESRPRGSDTGARLPLGYQGAYAAHLRETDAAGIAEGDTLRVRGLDYLVVTLDPDGGGMTRLPLMRPGGEPQPHPEWRQWR